MGAQTIGIIMVLIAGAIEALSNVIQHKATNQVDTAHSEAGAVLRTLGKPLWILGFVLMIVGYAFHVVSLDYGSLTLIQVIFVLQIVFILPFARLISGTHISRHDWFGAVVVTAGVAWFIVFAQPTEGATNGTGRQWVIAIAVIAALCAIVIGVGYRFEGAARAALLGVSGGLINGLVAPLTKGTLNTMKDAGGAGIFTTWIFWVTLIAALLGVLFPLLAFRAGPITASFPAVIALNPITATLLGIYLFDETLQGGAFNLLMMFIGGVAIFVGIVWLSRSQAIAQAFEEAKGGGPEGVSESATIL